MRICYNEDDSTYTVHFDNNIIKSTITTSGEVAAGWIDNILDFHSRRLSNLIVGLDLEWCPFELHNTKGENSVALLQLCVGRRCLIFQLLYCDSIPDKLCNFLVDDRFQFVGVGIKEDAEKLKRGYDIEMGNLVDLRDLAAERMKRSDMRQWGLKKLVKEVMGVEMEKPRNVTLSHWGRRRLSDEQIEYSAVDAFTSFEVGRRLI